MALGKKVKTLFLSHTEALAAGTTAWTNAVASHTFQDDVRVIGCQVGNDLRIPDGAVNADHELVMAAELSRHGVAEQDGAIARDFVGATWTAAIVAPNCFDGETDPFCFPEGHGIDFDDGEVIYLHSFYRNIGTVPVTHNPWAIVYYVER